jgi:hypothetical protein
MSTATLRPPAMHSRRRRPGRVLIWLLGVGGFMLVLAPVVLLAGAGNPPCPTTASAGAATLGAAPAGMSAQPLEMQAGRWYRVGATEYGGPGDPSSGSSGSIPNPTQAYLPAHPDTFAELSVLDTNPADTTGFTFRDANALDSLPYMTGLRVVGPGGQTVLYKRDVGYGQGPGQTISNGQPYRLDVWWQAAHHLAITKTPVSIQLAPPTGTAGTLGELPRQGTTDGSCPPAGSGTLTLTAGEQAQILPDGSATAPADAPRAVKLAIAAANHIHTRPYPDPDVHYGTLAQLWPAYDCSGSVSYVLYQAGLLSQWPDVSGDLEHYGQPGPGQWITVYANSAHAWIVVAGLAFDTADYGGPNIPTGTGPRWRQNPTANLQDGLPYVVRHPAGL